MPEYRAGLLVGFLGAYTTFSSFAMETLVLFEQGSHGKAWLNILSSVLLCMVAVWLGVMAGRSWFAPADGGRLLPALPWLGLVAALALAFALGLLGDATLARVDMPAPWRSSLLVAALGVLVTGFTAYQAATAAPVLRSLAAAVGWFGVQAAACGCALWLGSILGQGR